MVLKPPPLRHAALANKHASAAVPSFPPEQPALAASRETRLQPCMIQSFVSYSAHVFRFVAFGRWRRRSASCENFPGDGYPAIPRNLNSLLRPISPSAQSLLPAFPGLARMAQIIRSARRAAPRHPRSYRFSGLALVGDRLGVADAAISATSLHCAWAPAPSALCRSASRSASCAHLLSAFGNL